MHREVIGWLEQIRREQPGLFQSRRVVEAGSYDINGSARGLFEGGEYVGIDWRPGPGVDVVALAHEYEPAGPVDVVISTEMLEHDPHWEASLRQMVRWLRPGGTLLLTWATPKRERHELATSPATDYYAGLTPAQVAAVVQEAASWHALKAETVREGLDGRLAAVGKC